MPTPPARARSGPAGRLAGGPFLALAAIVGLVLVGATDQILPATSAHQAELRIWLASRAAGFTALGLLTIQITLGLVLSHPTNKSTWRVSKRLFPWHENAWIFVLAFLAGHVVSLVVDPYAGVGLAGALIPGLSEYRSSPVALGTMALWALLVTGATARYTRLLPPGAWLSIHRLSIVVFVLAWMHGLLSGTDFDPADRVLPRHRRRGSCRRRIPLLVVANGKADVFDVTRGGSRSMTTIHRLRRSAVLLGVVLTVFVGAVTIRAAADWTASTSTLTSKPPSIEHLRSALEAEQARSASIQAQFDRLAVGSADLRAALLAARDRIAENARQADTLQSSLADARARLKTLERSIRQAQTTAPRVNSTGPVAAIVRLGGGEPAEEHHEEGDD